MRYHAEYDRAYVGPEMVRRGDFHYRVYTGLQERGLLPADDWQTTLPGFGEPRASVEAEFGLVDSLSIFTDAATTSLRDGRHVYGGGGIAAYTNRFYGTLRTVADLAGGATGEVTLLSRLLGTDVSARHVQFLGTFASEEFPVRADPLASRSEGRLSWPIPLWGNHVLPASLTARHDIHQTGPSRTTFLARLSGAIWRVGWGNNLTLRAAGQEFTDLGGRATLRWRTRLLSPRLELGYRVAPEAAPTSYGGGISAKVSKHVGAEARVRREVNAAESWVASAGIRHRIQYFEWQLDGGYAMSKGSTVSFIRTNRVPQVERVIRDIAKDRKSAVVWCVMADDVPFWKRKPLEEMTAEEWESLCDGCGKCCLQVLEDVETGEYVRLAVSCRLLDTATCRCIDYSNRFEEVPGCVRVTPELAREAEWLPDTCAYRLVADGESLRWWHHLVSGSRETVHLAGVSVRGRVFSEEFVDEEEALDYPLQAFFGDE